MIPKPIIIKYDDLERLVKIAFQIRQAGPLTGPMPEPIVFLTGTGRQLKRRKYHVTWEEYIKRLRNLKIWGMTNNGKKIVIRYWVSEEATMNDIVRFFAHEIGHHTMRAYVDDYKEEKKAVTFERVAGLAHEIAEIVMKEDVNRYNRKKKGKK